jgi:hypothetical protein
MRYFVECSAEYHKNPVRTKGPGAKIWNRDLPNMNQGSNNFYFLKLFRDWWIMLNIVFNIALEQDNVNSFHWEKF